jgi:hypothetical protein
MSLFTDEKSLTPEVIKEGKFQLINNLFILAALEVSLRNLGTKSNVFSEEVKQDSKVLSDSLANFSEKLLLQLPKQTQDWFFRQVDNDKFQTLAPLIQLLASIKGEGSEKIFGGSVALLQRLVSHSTRGNLISPLKYKLIFEFLQKEVDADITKGEPALSVNPDKTGLRLNLNSTEGVVDCYANSKIKEVAS